MPDGDNVYFNLVKRDPNRDAFRFSSNRMPNCVLSQFNQQRIQQFSKAELYHNYDIAEIIRGDFSRLFFDIDVDNGVFTPEELDYTLEQIKRILQLLQIPFTNLNGAVEVSTRKYSSIEPLIKDWLDAFPQLLIIPTSLNDKEFSAHLYVYGYYFPRNDLFHLFSAGENQYIKDPSFENHLSSYIDQSVYVRAGAQKVFRFPLSGKAIKHRPCPPFSEQQLQIVSQNLLAFVCTKTSIDTQIITSENENYQMLKAYLNQFKGRNAKRDTRKMKKQDMQDELEDDILQHERISKKYIARQTTHALWWRSLILQVKNYLLSNPLATDDELFDIFIQEEYQYFSNSNNRKIRQPSDVKSAIREARECKYISIEDVIDLTDHSKPDDTFSNKNNCIQYTIDQFKAKVQGIDGITIPEFCKLMYFTFAFFTRSDSEKSSVLNILYTETKEKRIVIKGYEEFIRMLKPSPINVRLIREITKIDNRFNPPEEKKEMVVQSVPLITAFNLFDKYKQRFYDFRLCAENSDIKYFSLYSNPTSAPKTPIPQGIDEILNILATEKSDEADKDFVVNVEKKEYILNWFAYLLQHPESRNAVCLQISTVQGVGKNLLSNAVCDYLGSFFSEPSKDIDKIIGTYNGGIDNKLLIVMNEVDTKQKNVDLLKAVITEDTIQINVKYGMQYTGLNCANYLIYTNHEDTKTISSGDRRFTYIKSYGLPKPKSFYASICEPGKEGHLKPEIRKQFINHLLSRDLTNYKPNEPQEFDKKKLFEKREDSRSAIYRCLVQILQSKEYPKDYILQKDFIELVQKAIMSFEQDIFFKNFGIESLKGIDEQIRAELNNKQTTFTEKTLNSIINWDDEGIIEKYKSNKRDETRNKKVIALRTPKVQSSEISQSFSDPQLPAPQPQPQPQSQVQLSTPQTFGKVDIPKVTKPKRTKHAAPILEDSLPQPVEDEQMNSEEIEYVPEDFEL
jgi:hypothetical protein